MRVDIAREARRTLVRLWPRLEATFAVERERDPDGWAAFAERAERHLPALFGPLVHVYGARDDFLFHLEAILEGCARSWLERSAPLRDPDRAREADPAWFASNEMLAAVCYVDRWAGDLAGLRTRIPYLRELGVRYLHLMPLFAAPAGNSDGGYAVSSYREVDPALGTMAELAALAAELRGVGISLCLDFVFNHTSDEHAWAVEARAHPDDERCAYLMFPDRALPDAYDRTLREIFPETRRGSFTWVPEAGASGRWVWTTFNSFQWDLNYANPLVFRRMAGEMLFLANQGIEILRLDAVAFVWKRLGTASESLPEAHLLVRAFNAVCRIAAPSLLFLSEAIVHPAEVATYVDPLECQLSYNPLLMALSWEALATRDARLLARSMRRWHGLPTGCAWVNYVRSHDDIGWTFDDADAGALGIDGYHHRRFLNSFYTGRFEGSFARGLPFQENPDTRDARISGTTASLAGLETALAEEGPAEIELALDRIARLTSVALAIGGIPLLYLGDELATLNDYRYVDDPAKAADSRWVHRPALDPDALARRADPDTIEGRLFTRLTHLIAIRRREPLFAGTEATFPDLGNDHVLALVRHADRRCLIALANVTERPQTVDGIALRLAGLVEGAHDLVAEEHFAVGHDVTLEPYHVLWLISSDVSRGAPSSWRPSAATITRRDVPRR